MLDLLTRLVDKSLVAVDREHIHEPRYYLLETIRQYAREKLAASGEGEQIRAKHLDYFLKLAQRAEPEFHGAGQTEWSQKLEDEHENMRAALEWSLQGNVSAGQQLATTLWYSWHFNGHHNEAYKWLEKMLAVNPEEKTLVRAKLLSGAGWLGSWLGVREEIVTRFFGSKHSFIPPIRMSSAALALAILAGQARSRSDYDQAVALTEEITSCLESRQQMGLTHAFLLGNIASAGKF
jgi:hypothetical protein